VFSGIIETLGEVCDRHEGRLEVAPSTPFRGLEVGESVAVNGACLTVAAVTGAGFAADVMPETLRRTTLGGLTSGATVNLERALHIGDRVGGHLVTGHVDATGAVSALREDANARWATITAPEDLIALVAEKGSIAVDGISLTVVDVFDAGFSVSLIPVTLAGTTAGSWTVGSRVNLEADLIARYVARALAAAPEARVAAATAPGAPAS
jgi:riboflavin synthase